MGHKRLALELGEDPVNAPIDYVLESLDTIYKTQNENGNIRRVNVNIAATTVENYKKLKDANIGTYILFQETYHKPTYDLMHPNSLKSSYEYHLNAFDRAMKAGIEDVGGGVLFLKFGVTQVSSGSSTGVGGYKQREEGKSIEQFKTSDERTPIEVLNWLLDEGYIPSYCTACYRKGRTGETFMGLAKTGEIQKMCEPNALMTLMEYALDYGDESTCKKAEKLVMEEAEKINNDSIRKFINDGVIKLKEGQRDIYI